MADPHSDDYFVRAARKLAILTDGQLAECRHLQRTDPRNPTLGQVAYEHAYLDGRTLFAILGEADRLRAGERRKRSAWPVVAIALTGSTALLLGFAAGLLVVPPGASAPEPPRGLMRSSAPLRGTTHYEAGKRLLEQASREQFRPSLDAQRIDETLHAAIEELSAACALEPTHPAAFHARARARFALGDWERADQDFSRAIEIAPSLSAAYFERGTLRLEYVLATSGIHRDPDVSDSDAGWAKSAATDFRKAQELGLSGPELLLAEAAGDWASEGVDAAYVRCSSSLWETATVEELHRFRGEVLAAKEEYTAAERALSRAIELRAHYPEAALSRGLVRLKMGHALEASQDLTYCIERRRFPEPTLFHRGQAYYALGRFTSALHDWRRCLDLDSPRSERLRELLKEVEGKTKF